MTSRCSLMSLFPQRHARRVAVGELRAGTQAGLFGIEAGMPRSMSRRMASGRVGRGSGCAEIQADGGKPIRLQTHADERAFGEISNNLIPRAVLFLERRHNVVHR